MMSRFYQVFTNTAVVEDVPEWPLPFSLHEIISDYDWDQIVAASNTYL